MSLTVGTAGRNAQAAALAGQVDAGSGPGLVRLYTVPRPATPAIAPGAAVELAEFTLNDPSFSGPLVGVMTLDNTPVTSALGLAAGDAAWARVLDSTGVAVFDGSVTATGGGGDFIMATVSVSVGVTLNLVSGTISAPGS